MLSEVHLAMKAYVLVQIRTSSIHEVVANLRRLKGIKEAFMTFGPYDAIAIVEAEDRSHMARIVNIDIQVIPGVEKTLTCLAIQE